VEVVPIGNLIGGALGGIIGLRATLLVGAIVTCAGFLFIVFSPLRSLREPPTAADERAAITSSLGGV